MKNPIRQLSTTLIACALLATTGIAGAASVESVYGFDVSNPQAFVAAIDKLFESDDMKGHKVTVWASSYNGDNPSTHVLTANFDSYQAYQEGTARRLSSPDWLKYVLAVRDTAELTGESFFIERLQEGGDWRQHGAAAAYIMTVSDAATYAKAFRKLVDDAGHPGSIRLMEVRAGGSGITHVVLISAPDFASLNTYLDELLSGDAYKSFVKSVGSIRKINTVNMYTRVKSWGG